MVHLLIRWFLLCFVCSAFVRSFVFTKFSSRGLRGFGGFCWMQHCLRGLLPRWWLQRLKENEVPKARRLEVSKARRLEGLMAWKLKNFVNELLPVMKSSLVLLLPLILVIRDCDGRTEAWSGIERGIRIHICKSTSMLYIASEACISKWWQTILLTPLIEDFLEIDAKR